MLDGGEEKIQPLPPRSPLPDHWTWGPSWDREGTSRPRSPRSFPSWPSGPCTSTTTTPGRGRRGHGGRLPQTEWHFAEGCTREGFDEYICVLNPGDSAADLTFTFQTQEAGEQEDRLFRRSPRPGHLLRSTTSWAPATRPRSSSLSSSRWWPSAPCTSTTRGSGTGAAASWSALSGQAILFRRRQHPRRF